MASPFGGIGMMAQALRNFQQALQTAGHNVSNVNTPGYSRQRVELTANDPIPVFEFGWKSLGAGAGVATIGRLRDLYLQQGANQSAGNLSKFSSAAKGLGTIETTYNEPSDNGISAWLGKFFDAWSGLGSNPSDPSAKVAVRNAGQTLADRVRQSWQSLDEQGKQVDSQIQEVFKQINDLATQIDSLNKGIRAGGASGQMPNDLLDKRDQAVAKLASLTDVRTSTFADGSMAVYASGFTVVDSAGTLPFPTSYNLANGTVTDGTTTNTVRGGQLAGLFVQGSEVLNQQSRLDALANNLRSQVNAVHMTGFNAAGATGVKFFNDVPVPPQTGAADFDIDDPIKQSLDNVMTGVSGKASDGGLALSLAGLRDSAVAALGSKTFSTYFHDTVDALASSKAYYDNAATTEQAVSDQVNSQIQSISGVSLDDEMADMAKLQKSYQAAARTLTVFDQMAQDVLNMLNR